MGPCNPGDARTCYTGESGTEGVGPCVGGNQSCTPGGTWSSCVGQVLPAPEVCGDHIDNNCNGMVDEDVDVDGDGYTTCGGDCCDSTSVCGDPASVNPGAVEVAGDGVDNDCDGIIDEAPALCDMGLNPASTDPMDFAKAIDLCETTTMADKKWGVLSAKYSKTDGMGSPNAYQHAFGPGFGTGVTPKGGSSLAILGTGHTDATTDFEGAKESETNTAPFPADFFSANGNKLPNAPGCLGATDTNAHDPMMVTLQIRVPTNAKSFKLDTNFYSSEFPEYVCTPFNDFFVILLDSQYNGSPPNPTDKNLAFYSPDMGTTKYPVGVNLASTGLFTQCVNGKTGCAELGNGTITSCTGVGDLQGTSFATPKSGECDSNSLEGGATGWLETSGNVNPGEIITLRIAIWNTSDGAYQSLALVDNFQWSAEASSPGTVIFRGVPPHHAARTLQASEVVSETTCFLP
ncbi:MAG: putative metal-binding motif-containing protein [Deltaproteobacteria bacterium]